MAGFNPGATGMGAFHPGLLQAVQGLARAQQLADQIRAVQAQAAATGQVFAPMPMPASPLLGGLLGASPPVVGGMDPAAAQRDLLIRATAAAAMAAHQRQAAAPHAQQLLGALQAFLPQQPGVGSSAGQQQHQQKQAPPPPPPPGTLGSLGPPLGSALGGLGPPLGSTSPAVGDAASSSSTGGRGRTRREESSSGHGSASGKASLEQEKEKEPEPEEVPKCHLHKKTNKACKYCKAHTNFLESKSKETEDKRTAALEKMKGRDGPKAGGSDDKVPLPSMQYFPQVLRDRISGSAFYANALMNQEFSEQKEALLECDSCEPEVRGLNLDTAPSQFISIVYRFLTVKITEGQLRSLLANKNRMIRCAGSLFVRLGVHQDRYWELLADALLDVEEFVPFPGKGGEKMSEGLFVEQLLTKEKYCDLSLPRITVAQKKLLGERLVLYEQFRKRYAANLEVLKDRYSDPDGDIPVEVCSLEGEWAAGKTTGPPTKGDRRVTLPVKFSNGDEQIVSIGMIISPPSRGSADFQDLTRSRGRSYQELLERQRAQQKDAAVASGKDYCKNSGRRTVHAGGMTFIAGDRPEKRKRDGEDSDEEGRARHSRKDREKDEEERRKKAAIMEKYCQANRGGGGQDRGHDGVDRPERMRLG